MALPTRMIGDLVISTIGLGCMPLSSSAMLADRDRAIATIHHALDLGITLLDTANIYAPAWDAIGHNERLVAEALRTYPTGAVSTAGGTNVRDVVVTTKGGITRGDGETWGRDASPGALLAAAEASCIALETDVIPLYQFHRHDPSMTYEAQLRSLRAVQDAGLVARIGLSNCTLPELDLALDLLGGPADGGIVSVQNEWSPRYREDADVLARCAELGIAFLPWSPLGGAEQAHDVGSRYAVVAEVAAEAGCSPQEAVLAWLRQSSPVMIPIPGASRPATVTSIVMSTTVQLTPGQVERLSAATPEDRSMYPDSMPRSPLR
jgi:aryl-alcohol dehydrogenase-like predicted oxidoreductase